MKTMMIRMVAATMFVVVGWGPGAGGIDAAQGAQTQASRERFVIPSVTDPAISAETGAHFVVTPNPSVTASGKLFVFLPGTGGLPKSYRLIARAAANLGYHAIGLNYPNPKAISSLCLKSIDMYCYWDTRREVVTGDDHSPLLAVDTANSIVNRVQKLLAYIDAQYPSENFGQFLLPDGRVDWSVVVMGGHSQGGGHAGVMAKLYGLHRACYFASPADWSKTSNRPASWLSEQGATPAVRQYGFTHLRDTTVPYSYLSAIWNDVGLQSLGSAVSVDGKSQAYGNSHQFTTNIEPNLSGGTTNPYHGATVVDAATPIAANGTPVYESVWTSMCFK